MTIPLAKENHVSANFLDVRSVDWTFHLSKLRQSSFIHGTGGARLEDIKTWDR
jgi:hypothetical protein